MRVPACARCPTPARSSMRSVWSRLGTGSSMVVTPSASRPAKSRHDFTWALAHGQLVGDRAQPRAVDRQRRVAAVARLVARAPIARSGSITRSTGRRLIEASPSSVNVRPSWPASQPGSRRMSVPALPTSIGPVRLARVAQAGAAHDDAREVHLDERAERARRFARGARVGGLQVVVHAHRFGGHRADERRAVGDRLVRRRAQLAAERAAPARSARFTRAPRGSRARR